MAKKTRIWIFSLGDPNSSAPQIRFLGPFGYFPEKEFEVIYATSLNAILRLPYIPDIIVFHRNSYRLQEIDRIIKFAGSHGIPTVMDIDDLITHLPLQHPSYLYYQGAKHVMIELFKKVDIITLTNNRLKEYYKEYNPNVYVVPNLIDGRIWNHNNRKEKRDDGKVVIGYSGALEHASDFKRVIPAIKFILSKYPSKICFKFFGYVPDELRVMDSVSHVPMIGAYREYAAALINSNLDIAIAPLEDNPHNQCKSNIKFLEYSVCGYSGIYSAVGPYLDSIEHRETGLLVKNTTDEWISGMELLINNPGLRKSIRTKACQCVKSNYSLKEKPEEMYRLYTQIVSSRRNRTRGMFSLSPLISYGPYLIYAQLRGFCHKMPKILKWNKL